MTAETIAALERELEALKSDLEQARRGAAEATRYRAILDGCEDVISVLDSEGRCDFVSEIFATRTGLEVARMVGGGGLTFIHPEDRRGAQAVLVDMVARGPGARARLEYRRIRAGGGWAHVEAIARNLLDDPDIRGIVTVGREIDEAVRLRQELREAQDRYEHALRISREAIWERDLVQGTIFLSPRMLEELGYLPGDVPPGLDVLRDLVHEDDRPDADAASTAHLATGARYEVEVRLRLKSGDYRWFRVVGEALRGYDGRALRMLGQISDVHDRKLAEVQLRNSERMFRSLFESTSVAVTLRDVTAQRFVDCNDAALRLYRARSREDLIHKSPVDLAPKTQPDGRPSLEVAREHIGRALRDGFHHFEWEAMRLDGEVFPSALRITVIDLPDGRRLMQTMIEDVTERKRAERAARQAELALAKAKEDAVAASAMKSAFLANMSHELRTPLNGVIGMIELLAATGLDDRQRHYAEIARTSARLLLSVINDVLDFSKIEAGKLELEAIEFSLPEILEEVRANMAHAAEAKGLALACDVTPALAAPLVGDPARLRQVLLNLVNNAVKFTRVGAVTVRASAVSDAGRAVRLRVEVKDTGIGIVPEAQAKLFQPFTQVDASTTRVHGGSGLGLAICRQLIERMDGVIGVTSALGEGATFWFEVTLSRAAPGEWRGHRMSERSAPRVATPSTPVEPRGHVLVVEDSPINAEVAREILRAAGYEIDVAADGAAAIAAARGRAYDLILMDCQLPLVDGYEATRRIRELERARELPGQEGDRRLPIVALTASVTKDDLERCAASGMDDHVSKPVDARLLLAVVDRRITGHAEAPVSVRRRSEPGPPGPPVADLARALERLRGDRALLRRISAQFVAAASETRHKLQSAVEQKDARALAFVAHRLRGQAASFDAEALVAANEELESIARHERWSDAPASLRAVEAELDRLLHALTAEEIERSG